MKYIDTHCHLNFAIYHDDVEEVIQRTKDDDVAVINIGTQYDTSKKAVLLAQQYKHLYAMVGLHPIHTTASFHDHDEVGEEGDAFRSRGEIFDIEKYRTLAQSPKVVGIGECGFDFYHNTQETKEAQELAFRGQLDLACELDLPVMLHVRPSQDSYDAYHDTLEVLKEYKKKYPSLRGQAHFFAGTKEIAQAFIDLGFYISFTGVITFAKVYEELIESIPLNRILSETDAPYVTPIPHRGKRNEPLYVIEVVKKIAEVKGVSNKEVASQIRDNVKELYGIDF